MSLKTKPLDRDAIKLIAIVLMLGNHIAAVFLPLGVFPWQIISDLGYFTAITMCCFLVERYRHTRSRKKYALRLLVFALLSQFPWRLALVNNHNLNMLFTLLLCFLLLAGLDRVESKIGKAALALAAIALSLFCDWALLAPVFTLLFAWAGEDQRKKGAAFAVSILLFGGLNFASYLERLTVAQALLWTLSAVSGQVLAAVCILFLYSGQADPAGQGLLQVVLLRLLPPAPAGPGRPAAPDRVTDMAEKNAPDFRPGRSLSKSLAEFRRPQAAEENQIVFPAACMSEKHFARSERRRDRKSVV